MIDYQTWCRIRQLYDEERLSAGQIARELNLSKKTVAKWIGQKSYERRRSAPGKSKLDPYKGQIVRWVHQHHLSARQIFERVREAGYGGGYTILTDFIRQVRPKPQAAFLTLHFAPAECAQVDWGSAGSIAVGSTRRRLSFFVMVLSYSRLMYVEFTLAEKQEHFVMCHRNALEYFGGVPGKIMVDNCKVAVLKRERGEPPLFHPRYLDLARHYGFRIEACGVGQPQQKGRVENAVGSIKKNFLRGLQLASLSAVNTAARQWLDTVANRRTHGQTRRIPAEVFAENEKDKLKPLPIHPYDGAVITQARANSQFRVILESNRYSVPARYAGALLILKLYPERLCLYHRDQLIAEHPRSYDRHQDFEHPDHVQPLLRERRKAKEHRLLLRFLRLSPCAEAYYQQLRSRRFNPGHHVQKIVALSEIYGSDAVAGALQDAFDYQAFSCEYIANILEQRARRLPQPGALHLTRRQDLLELDLPDPDLSLYEAQPEPEDDHEAR